MAHPVPDILLEQDIAILGQKGAGKSISAKGLVERLLTNGRRVIVLDPLNHWFGLKAMADGTPGYPIIVIGGPNADIPLNVKGGALLGEILAAETHSFIIDVSDLVRSEVIAFSTAFLTALYKHNRAALWLIAEEADVFAPQNPAMDGTRAMLDAMDQIARRGRQRGFRLWSVTQRPARLNKDVLSMASTLLLMRIRGPQDRAAAEEWIKGHASKADAAEVVNGLAGLEVGEGYIYAPDVEMLERVRFPMIKTLDTSSTPKAGERSKADGATLADVGEALEALRSRIAPPPVNDAAPSAKPPSAPTSPDVAAIRAEARRAGHIEGYEKGHAEGRRVELMTAADQLKRWYESTLAEIGRLNGVDLWSTQIIPAQPVVTDDERPAVMSQPHKDEVTVGRRVDNKPSPTVCKILNVIAKAYPAGLTFRAAAKRAGVSMRSSALLNYERAVLASPDVIVRDGRLSWARRPEGFVEMDNPIDTYAANLPPAYAKMLRAIASGTAPLSKNEIAVLAGLSITSSGIGAGLKELMALELVDKTQDGRFVLSADFR